MAIRLGRCGWVSAGLLVGLLLLFPGAARSWSAPITIDQGFGRALNAVACPSATQCTAVDDNGQEVTFDPTSPGTAASYTVDSGHRLFGVACPTVQQCTAVDDNGQQVTFDPASPGVPTPYTVFIDTSASGNGLNQNLVRGVEAKASAKKLKLTAKLSHGKLMIKLETPAPSVQITISRPAITVTKTLADRVKAGKVTALGIIVTAASPKHRATRLTLISGTR